MILLIYLNCWFVIIESTHFNFQLNIILIGVIYHNKSFNAKMNKQKETKDFLEFSKNQYTACQTYGTQ